MRVTIAWNGAGGWGGFENTAIGKAGWRVLNEPQISQIHADDIHAKSVSICVIYGSMYSSATWFTQASDAYDRQSLFQR